MTGPERVLNRIDVIAIVIGVVIGAGIFSILPRLIVGMLGDPWLVATVWIAGGILAAIGALCLAELATAFPDPGGEYHFLTRAYGREVGFMYGWARMTVIQTGSIATLAFVAGDTAQQILPLGPYGPSIYAILSVVGFTWVNVLGMRQTTSVQKVLETCTVIGLLVLIIVGFSATAPAAGPAEAAVPSWASFGQAMVFVLFIYGGWNEAVYISAEVKDRRRDLPVGLLTGLGIIIALYVLINLAFLHALGPAGLAKSNAPGIDVMRDVLGDGAAMFMAGLILVIVLTSVNVTILTGARTSFALGRDFAPFSFLGEWTAGRNQPTRALLVQAAIALALVLLGAVSKEGVKTMVDYLSPVFWLFFILTVFAVIILRHREPAAERPFKVPFYPLTPLLFCLASAYVLYSSVAFLQLGALVGVAVLAAGLPFLVWVRRAPARAAQTS